MDINIFFGADLSRKLRTNFPPLTARLVALRAKLSGAVYCYRSCLCVCNGRAGGVCLCVSLFVGLLPRLLEIACIDLHQTGCVDKGSVHLKLIKFWPSRAPGKGGLRRGEIFLLRLTTASAQCLRLSGRFFVVGVLLLMLFHTQACACVVCCTQAVRAMSLIYCRRRGQLTGQ